MHKHTSTIWSEYASFALIEVHTTDEREQKKRLKLEQQLASLGKFSILDSRMENTVIFLSFCSSFYGLVWFLEVFCSVFNMKLNWLCFELKLAMCVFVNCDEIFYIFCIKLSIRMNGFFLIPVLMCKFFSTERNNFCLDY